MLNGKTVLLGVTGGIACFKAAALASMLVKQHACVEVVMTKNATEFVTPLTFEQLTGNRVSVDTFDRNFVHQVEHISLASRADMVLIAPATANVIAKLAHGLADDMLTTTVLACSCPKAIAPAMNTGMFENPVTQDNIGLLRRYGWEIVEPASGRLACGTSGKGRLPEPEDLLEVCLHTLAHEKDMAGLSVLVTAGPTQEAIDPVRYITNRSSGKMGYAIAEAAQRRGARVTLISGPTSLVSPQGVEKVSILSTQDLYEAMLERCPSADIIIQAAAPADFTPALAADQKIKKQGDGGLTLTLRQTPDVAAQVGRMKKPGQTLVGFAAETNDVLSNAQGKLEKKNLDMIVANDVTAPGAGFDVDTNIVTFVTRSGLETLPCLPKRQVADELLDRAMKLRKGIS